MKRLLSWILLNEVWSLSAAIFKLSDLGGIGGVRQVPLRHQIGGDLHISEVSAAEWHA